MELPYPLAITLFLFALAVYIWAGVFVCRKVWLATGNHNFYLSVLVRCFFIAFIFSPTFYACGAAAPVPYPILIVAEIVSEPSPCDGQPIFMLPVVGTTFFVSLVLYILIHFIRKYRGKRLKVPE